MGNPRLFTPEQELEICEMYERVERARIVADAFGSSYQTIYRILDKHGIKRTHRHPKPKSTYTGNRHKGINHAQVCEMYRSGHSVHEISKCLGCSDNNVYHHLKREGLYWTGKRKDEIDALTPRMLELHNEGKSDYEIEALMGVSRYVINDRLRKSGIERGKGNHSPFKAVCLNCGTEFTANKKNQIYCSPTCQRAASWRRRNDAKRAATSDGVADISLRDTYERYGGRCYLCGRKTDWNDYKICDGWFMCGPRYPTREHVIALSNGGTHTLDNIRLACFECNTRKSNKGQMRLPI